MGCIVVKQDSSYEVFRRYDFVYVIGCGATSQVHEAIHKESGLSFAVKCVVKEEAQQVGRTTLDLTKQAQLWGCLDHPNICRLHNTFQDSLLYYFVMERLDGPSYFEKLEAEIVLEEPTASRMAFQMASAITHLHERGICHRDLKPESWLLSDNTELANMKLINFGFAELLKEDDVLSVPFGTLHYLAPEVLRGSYGRAVDVWTLGVVVFLSLYAAYPFDGEDLAGVMQAILSDEPGWSDSCFALSEQALDFMKIVLCKEPSSRPTAESLTRHHWFAIRARPSFAISDPGARKLEVRKSLLGQQARKPIAGAAPQAAPKGRGPRSSVLVTSSSILADISTTKEAKSSPLAPESFPPPLPPAFVDELSDE